jgi:cytoskeletal protein RodZ
MSSLGETFRQAREARGFALSDVSEQIHIRSVYLNAIENEDWASIGAPVYTRGFLRTYARFLGLDAEAIVARYNEIAGQAAATATAAAPVSSAGSSDRGGPSVWVIAVSIVAVLLVGFAFYEYVQYQSGSPATVANDATPTGPASAPPAAAAAADQGTPAPDASAEASAEPSAEQAAATSNSLDLRLTQRSWLRVVVDGKSIMEGLFPAGTVRSVVGKSATIRAGNAAGVSVTVNGKNIGALGGSGDVVERTFNLRGE